MEFLFHFVKVLSIKAFSEIKVTLFYIFFWIYRKLKQFNKHKCLRSGLVSFNKTASSADPNKPFNTGSSLKSAETLNAVTSRLLQKVHCGTQQTVE